MLQTLKPILSVSSALCSVRRKSVLLASFLCAFVSLCLMVPQAVCTGDDPDELYRKGRFLEAEDLYARLSMDNPDNTTYRYNMGCSAYKRAYYILAEACFVIVFTKADDDTLRFKAAYNLGNVKFKQKNFVSAVTWFKKALQYNAGNTNAQFNLELALKNLEKDKSTDRNQNPQKPPPKESKDKNKENDKKENEKSSQEETPPEDRPSKPQGQANDNKRTGSEDISDKTSPPNPPGTYEAGDDEKPLEDVSGELKARSPMMAEQEETQSLDDERSPMDKKKAEALLDNISEDPSRFFRSRIPERRKRGGRSMKDW